MIRQRDSGEPFLGLKSSRTFCDFRDEKDFRSRLVVSPDAYENSYSYSSDYIYPSYSCYSYLVLFWMLGYE